MFTYKINNHNEFKWNKYKSNKVYDTFWVPGSTRAISPANVFDMHARPLLELVCVCVCVGGVDAWGSHVLLHAYTKGPQHFHTHPQHPSSPQAAYMHPRPTQHGSACCGGGVCVCVYVCVCMCVCVYVCVCVCVCVYLQMIIFGVKKNKSMTIRIIFFINT